ncbi:polyprenyl synthetase family protein [Streptomyces lushanensis]|uniref:polyprenyl synthetase family protein n=1 Tax=Streptomyces lushanensis TaxID=1434255 RepID=UPI0014746E18|nr:polyprenyl synthetase family protein [Streptomyces lushanensis]
MTRSPDAVLARTRALTIPPLRAAVADLHPSLSRVCAYHFGWCDRDGAPVSGAVPSKMVRAAITLLAAEAAGDTSRDPTAVAGAVAVELLHNYTLLHDDILDKDTLRRGRPTAWAVFGTDLAILAGDALATAAARTLTAVRTEAGHRALATLLDCSAAICDGQADDLDPSRLTTIDDYLRMSAGKTGMLLAGSAEIGATLASGSDHLVEGLRSACLAAALAWQAANDVEDIWGDPAVTGKPAFSDLRRRKATLPVLAAVRSGTPAGNETAALLTDPTGRPWDVTRTARLIEEAGGRAFSEQLVRDQLGIALEELERTDVPSPTKDDLATLFRLIVTRTA